jgi:SAM-dependent methyltransferase
LSEQEGLRAAQQLWDKAAETFDNEPDHGLRDPITRSAWRDLLGQWLPVAPRKILDIGCGTGSLTLLLAELGHDVIGVDLSPAMVVHAKTKSVAAGYHIPFQVMDAANPQFASEHFDVILCRHLLWALPEPALVLQRWASLLAPTGKLILIEGFWHTGAGLHAQRILSALPLSLTNVHVQPLSGNSQLWGGKISDERYAILADNRVQPSNL